MQVRSAGLAQECKHPRHGDSSVYWWLNQLAVSPKTSIPEIEISATFGFSKLDFVGRSIWQRGLLFWGRNKGKAAG